MKPPNPAIVVDLIDAFRRSKTMFAAVALGVFDRLPAECGALARELNVQEDALERLLDTCVGLKLLRKSGGVYRNRPVAAAYLRRDSPRTMTGYILYSNNALYRLWGNLEDAIREGTPRWQQTFGGPEAIFEHFFKTDEAMHDFLMGMHGFGQISSPAVVAAFDLSRFRRLVDLGGATGHLALAACDRYPELHAAVFDLPRVIGFAREKLGGDTRIELLTGDFFTDPLPEADLFAVGRILHDWGDEKVRVLLKKIYDRLPEGGALLIAERLLNDDKSGPLFALMQSLSMLVCTEGEERTLGEYRALLEEAGFRQIEGRKTGAVLDAVLAVRRTG
jgi:acetylserotonin N-methyltransferase